MAYLRSSYLLLPQKPGVYLFLDKGDNVLYVGKARDLKKRVSSYFNNPLGEKTRMLVANINRIRIVVVESELDALLLEANFIKKYLPKYNIKLTDGKAYPLIRITKNDIFPTVLLARKMDDNKSVYFGPFPNTQAVRTVLKTVRHIFPYQSTLHHAKKPCLYYHLGLCPCVQAFDTSEQRRQYKKNIRFIIRFLDGKKKHIVTQLQKEQALLVKEEAFEKAKDIQKKLDAIFYITSNSYKPFEYETNPNLRDDLRKNELNQLQEILKKYGTVINLPKRIECFDISTIQGFHSVGSMVVFINGEKESSYYRRFKIKNQKEGTPNDFAMMEEVLTRRFQHNEWPLPDLLIVDGGKGQITSAQKVLTKRNLRITLIGLAKREEIIITENFKEIRLPHDTPALQLIMRIRDEAHRFAITYHRKLRQINSFH